MSVPEEHKKHGPKKVSFSVFIVSSSRHRDKRKEDVTGEVIERLISESGHSLVRREVIPDDVNEIRKALLRSCDDSDVIIFSGGTGVHPEDVTPEALEPLLEKKLPGFGELFRFLSYSEVGSSAFASRAIAGTYRGKLVFILPGSPDAANLAMSKLILPEASHLVWLASGGHS